MKNCCSEYDLVSLVSVTTRTSILPEIKVLKHSNLLGREHIFMVPKINRLTFLHFKVFKATLISIYSSDVVGSKSGVRVVVFSF